MASLDNNSCAVGKSRNECIPNTVRTNYVVTEPVCFRVAVNVLVTEMMMLKMMMMMIIIIIIIIIIVACNI